MAVLADPRLTLRAKFFRGFADPSRLAILEALRQAELTVSQITEETELTQGNVSGHLACLRDCGLVENRQEWRHVHYRLTDPRVAALLRAADGLMADTAEQVYACAKLSVLEGDHDT